MCLTSSDIDTRFQAHKFVKLDHNYLLQLNLRFLHHQLTKISLHLHPEVGEKET